MKTFNITFKESGNKSSFKSNEWNDFSAKLFQQTPFTYIEDVENMEIVFNEGFENVFIKIEVKNADNCTKNIPKTLK